MRALVPDEPYKLIAEKGHKTYARGFTWRWVVIEAGGRRYFEFHPAWGFRRGLLYAQVGWKLVNLVDGRRPYGSDGIYSGLGPQWWGG